MGKNSIPSQNNRNSNPSERNKEAWTVKVYETDNKKCDAFIVALARVKLQELNLNTGDLVLLRSREGNVTLCMVVEDDGVPNGIRMSRMTRINLDVDEGDFVTIEPVNNIQPAKQVSFVPHNGPVFMNNPDLLSNALQLYFKGKGFGVNVGDNFIVKNGEDVAEFKIVNINPINSSSYSTVGPETLLQIEGYSAPDEKSLNVVQGYEKQLKMIKYLVNCKLANTSIPFSSVHVDRPAGILLYGPPGTGKSLIAFTICKNSGANVINITFPEIMKDLEGKPENKLRKAFSDAKKKSPSIIVIDELHNFGTRIKSLEEPSDQNLVIQLINLMDDLDDNSRVIVIGITNKIHLIEPELRRPGRFDHELFIGLPSEEERFAILNTYKLLGGPEVDLEEIVAETQGFSGADLVTLGTDVAVKFSHKLPVDSSETEEICHTDTMENLYQAVLGIKGKRHPVLSPDVHWMDIVGLSRVKKDLQDLVKQIKFPEKFQEFENIFKVNVHTVTKKLLFYGPPGCGKTLLAKALATDLNANFISVNPVKLLSDWYERSTSTIAEYFDAARRAAPCILFFREIDAVVRKKLEHASSDATNGFLNDMVTEMDKLESEENIIVIGSTSRPDAIDPTILTPDRFSQHYFVPIPAEGERKIYLQQLIKRRNLSIDIDIEKLAKKTYFFSPVDLNTLVDKACRLAIREEIETEHLNCTKHEKPVTSVGEPFRVVEMEQIDRDDSEFPMEQDITESYNLPNMSLMEDNSKFSSHNLPTIKKRKKAHTTLAMKHFDSALKTLEPSVSQLEIELFTHTAQALIQARGISGFLI